MNSALFSRRQIFLAVAGAAALAAGIPAYAQSTGTGAESVESIIVTGTRATGRTSFDALAPIDVLGNELIEATVSSDLSDSLAQLIPSFTRWAGVRAPCAACRPTRRLYW